MYAAKDRQEDVGPTLHLEEVSRRAQSSRVLQTLAGPPTPPRRKVGERAPTGGAGGHDVDQDGELPSGTELVGRYRLEETVGRGGMASVYRGRHIDIGNTVAIKVMSSEVAKLKGAVARFLTEARAVAAVQHPGVVRVTDFGELDCGRPFMVMEHLAGRDLDTLVCDRGPLAWDDLKPILIQVCNALGAAHEAGIVHRDVKPANIFVLVDAPEGQDVKVLDFGIAKVTDEMVRAEDDPQTQTNGWLVGTPDYMAPEQGGDGEIDQRADIYALGVTAFTCLTGQLPFPEAANPIAQIAKHMYETPPTLEEAGATVRSGVQELISRAMEKDPADRFQSMDEFRAAIEGLAAEEAPAAPRPARRYGFLAAAAALVVAGLGIVTGGEANAELAGLQASMLAAVVPGPANIERLAPVVDTIDEPKPLAASTAVVPEAPVAALVPAASELEPEADSEPEPEANSEPEPEQHLVPEATSGPNPKRYRRHRRAQRPQPEPTAVEPEPEPVRVTKPEPPTPEVPTLEAPTPEPTKADPVDQQDSVQEVGAIKNPYG